ncbi:MAG TPA: hypothetical protein VFB79_05605 [Candidatus Angelobacter sp.]|nr:hypothetical protein [Candidatus Angelobacter sp.]
MTVLKVIAGLALVFAALHDMFHSLFHPSGRGAIAEFISFRLWRLWRKLFPARHNWLTLAGPLAFVATVITWTAMIVAGWALVYSPFLLSKFVMVQGLDISQHHSYFDAINVSLGSLITVAGDFNTTSRWLRFGMGLEAVMGFVLLSASLSWVLSIYPILEYRRSASHRLFLLHRARESAGISLQSIPERETEQLVIALATDLTKIRNDLAQFPITYYFHEKDKLSAFPSALALAFNIADRAAEHGDGVPIQIAGIVLQQAIHDFLCLVSKWFLNMPDEEDDRKLMHAFAQDHFFQELHSAS